MPTSDTSPELTVQARYSAGSSAELSSEIACCNTLEKAKICRRDPCPPAAAAKSSQRQRSWRGPSHPYTCRLPARAGQHAALRTVDEGRAASWRAAAAAERTSGSARLKKKREANSKRGPRRAARAEFSRPGPSRTRTRWRGRGPTPPDAIQVTAREQTLLLTIIVRRRCEGLPARRHPRRRDH